MSSCKETNQIGTKRLAKVSGQLKDLHSENPSNRRNLVFNKEKKIQLNNIWSISESNRYLPKEYRCIIAFFTFIAIEEKIMIKNNLPLKIFL